MHLHLGLLQHRRHLIPTPHHGHHADDQAAHPHQPRHRAQRRTRLRNIAHSPEADPIPQEHRHRNEPSKPVEHGENLEGEESVASGCGGRKGRHLHRDDNECGERKE